MHKNSRRGYNEYKGTATLHFIRICMFRASHAFLYRQAPRRSINLVIIFNPITMFHARQSFT